MAKWQMQGLQEYVEHLQKIGANTPEVIGAGVYAMADVVADSVRKNIEQLPTVKNEENIETYHYKTGTSKLSEEEKEGLLDGFGITPMQRDGDGFYNVKLGFDGYNKIKTKKYPKGQPNALIARITDSGSSYRQKTPFMKDAVNGAKKEALEKGKAAVDKKLQEIK